jgi:Na+-translocating ferredoxin:NAD+ oxidoreductase subunit B
MEPASSDECLQAAAAPRFDDELVDRIDAILPQTQCTRCGYDGCRPYAAAIATGSAAINRCPPGGQTGVVALATLLRREALPLEPQCGPPQALRIASIDAAHCIGCTLCIRACPVDAIVGAPRAMHVVLPALCTGCDLCIAPCPVDCISMHSPEPPREWNRADANAARDRHQARALRLTRPARQRPAPADTVALPGVAAAPLLDPRHAAIVDAAIARVRARRLGTASR